MWQQIGRVARDERGEALIGWVAMGCMTFLLVVALWTALYGPPGQAIKQTVQAVAARYAAGFEAGLDTAGPAGGPSGPQGQVNRPSGADRASE